METPGKVRDVESPIKSAQNQRNIILYFKRLTGVTTNVPIHAVQVMRIARRLETQWKHTEKRAIHQCTFDRLEGL